MPKIEMEIWMNSVVCVLYLNKLFSDFPGGSVVKIPPANAGDVGLIPESGRSLGEGNGSPCQYSCLENPMYRGAWQAIVYGVSKESDMTDRLTLSLFNHGTLLLLMNE